MSATLINELTFDEASGSFSPTAGVVGGTPNGTVEYSLDRLISAGGGSSIALNGTSYIVLTHDASLAIAFPSFNYYFQVDELPPDKVNILSKDRVDLPGGVSLEAVVVDGELRLTGYKRDRGGSARAFNDALAAGVATLQVNTAYQVIMSTGAGVTRLYLDKVEVGSIPDDTGWENNDQDLVLGAYSVAFQDKFDGVLDHFQIYTGPLTTAQLNATPDAVTITHEAPGSSFSLPKVPGAPTGNIIHVSSGVGDGAPAAGSDSTGTGTLSNPYATLGKALSLAASSDTIVLRKGTYFENDLTVSDTNLTITGLDTDISTDPLDPDNWPTLAGYVDPSTVTWEDSPTGPANEYRTTSTSLISSNEVHAVLIAGTSWQLPRYEPLGGMKQPNQMLRLYPYLQADTGVSSKESFRDTGTVNSNDRKAYHGPGTYKEDDGRIHIRLDPVDSGYYGGVIIDQIPNKNPANNSIYMWNAGRKLFSSISNGLKLVGLIIRGYDRIDNNSSSKTGIEMNRCIWQGMQYKDYGWHFSGNGDITLNHTIVDGGMTDWTAWDLVKNAEDGTSGKSKNYGRITPFLLKDSGTIDFAANDSAFLNLFDIVVHNRPGDIRFTNCYGIIRDDWIQPDTSDTRNVYLLRCFGEGPMMGWQKAGTAPDASTWKMERCLQLCNRAYLNRIAQRIGHGVKNSHGGGNSDVNLGMEVVNCTIIGAVPCRETVPQPNTGMTFNRSSSNVANTWIHGNNIIAIRGMIPPGRSSTITSAMRRFVTADTGTSCISDGNQYHVLMDAGAPSENKRLFTNVRETAGGSDADFDDMNSYKANSRYLNSGSKFGSPTYGPRREENSVENDPQFAVGTANALRTDSRGKPPSDYIPTNTHAAVDLSAYGFTNLGFAGALDPNGDGSEVGPRA